MLKFLKSARSRLIGATATGFIAALAMGGTVAAITDTEFLYSPTKAGYYTIHPMDMSPESSDMLFEIDLHPQSATSENGLCFVTGLHLPHGSRITQLAVWYRSQTIHDPLVYLVRTTLADGLSNSLIVNGFLPDDSGLRKLAVVPLTGGSTPVSNIGFAYGFGFCPGNDGTFEGARIAYTYNNAGD